MTYPPAPTSSVARSSAPVVQGRVVSPTATANSQQSAVYAISQVLKEIVHAVPAAFSTENQILSALTAIENFAKAFVPGTSVKALATGDERAPVEDVSKRPAPNGVAYSIPTTAPVIDYDRLAAAMVRAQMAIAAEQEAEQETTSAPAPAPETQDTETPQYG